MPDPLNLSNLRPAAPRRERKRIGRGMGSGKGRYAGRGIKGQKARAGSHKMRPGFEGGQNPVYMRMAKQRGATSKDAMPIGPFRTSTVPINVRDLDRFDSGTTVTLDVLVEAGMIKNTKTDVKILGDGELSKKLTVVAHRFSASAREKIEQAGGSIEWLRGEPQEKKRRRRTKKKGQPASAAETPTPEEPPSDQEAAVDQEASAAESSQDVAADGAPQEGA
jgi:large subunit ribosomal protein L15